MIIDLNNYLKAKSIKLEVPPREFCYSTICDNLHNFPLDNWI